MSYADVLPELVAVSRADPVGDPQLVILNEDLSKELDFDPDWLRSSEGRAWLTGQSEEPTTAQAYAGHQFGKYVPRLGDGRALLLAERTDRSGTSRDIHLKGSGPTPFSRGGDGKAALGPMLREYVIGEFLHAVSIPTTRALAVLTTGEHVWRDRGPERGAILVRVATGLVRVGTFQYAATRDGDVSRRLADYVIERYYPELRGVNEPYVALFQAVCDNQASLIADWMAVGFIHGVMNTDNMVIAGESIDFGPCAFLDIFDRRAVFSSIDHAGRYAYGNQPAIAQWNLARFAESILPLIEPDTNVAVAKLGEILTGFVTSYEREIGARMAAKFGLDDPCSSLIDEGLDLMERNQVDFTTFFRALGAGEAPSLVADSPDFAAWYARWESEVDPEARRRMASVNPLYIPRNHHVDRALTEASDGNLASLERLVSALTDPYRERSELADLAEPPPPDTPRHVTFCGT
ncbi:protein adenylyltransferase SelO [Bowdeniella massiliensis]|uniref:protein adenylyltransferase SelO n=1 Tax=Bowdeniella massiliensis TaxID=2932264 RepID=UPI0020296349|nr:YdiU family protein [Bowdeniella massiliensis]